MSKLYIMVGIPGSGKSYHAQQLQSELEEEGRWCRIVSSDTYRKIVCGDENDQNHNEMVFKCMYNDMISFIDKFNYDVIVDATNTTMKSRRKIFDRIKSVRDKLEDIIAYVIPTPYYTCVYQDKMRDRTVGEAVIQKFIQSFQFPQKFEGFTKIWVGRYREEDLPNLDRNHFWAILKKMSDFDQKNYHHIYTLSEHCERLAKNYPHDRVQCIAGILHDVGKLYTQTIDEKGIAHYYNHDSVGTYFLASNIQIIPGNSWDFIFEVLFYVNYHMRAHNDFCRAKAERKYKAIFGEERFNNLLQFAEYDRIASGTYKEDCNE